jgi:hypothetical protein
MHESQNPSPVIDKTYLPFTADELHSHFLVDAEGQIAYFQKSAQRYHEFLTTWPDRNGIPISKARNPCQIEKDERFWTATTLKRLVDSAAGRQTFTKILSRTFGDQPPFQDFADWRSCLDGRLQLVLEATLPSPPSYVQWLRDNLSGRHLIPYVLHAAQRANARTLEGATHLDGIIFNIDNGFALFIEAKVLSDVSTVVSFDLFRNQIARNLDVLLEPSADLPEPLHARQPEKTLFSLLSPGWFRERPYSRLYGFLYDEYTSSPSTIGRDLPHRTNVDWKDLARRIGWMTFEDIAAVFPDACPWLSRNAG